MIRRGVAPVDHRRAAFRASSGLTCWRPALLAALAAVAVWMAASCGGDGDTAAVSIESLAVAASEERAAAQSDDEEHHHVHDTAETDYDNADMSMINASSGELPDLEMIDVSSGATVNLQSLAGNIQPLLFWFWSPH